MVRRYVSVRQLLVKTALTEPGAAYTASKHGLVGLTKNTASFYGSKGIRCNALIMGGMDTNIVDAFKSNVNAEGMKKTHDLGAGVKVPLCDTNQAADVCVSLTFGGGAGLINGACIPVDHGWCGTWGIS